MSKKILGVVLTIAMIATLFCVSTASASADSSEVHAGDTVNYTITVSGDEGTIGGLAVDITYNDYYLTLADNTYDLYKSGAEVVNTDYTGAIHFNIAAANGIDFTDDESLITFHFTANEDTSIDDLGLSIDPWEIFNVNSDLLDGYSIVNALTEVISYEIPSSDTDTDTDTSTTSSETSSTTSSETSSTTSSETSSTTSSETSSTTSSETSSTTSSETSSTTSSETSSTTSSETSSTATSSTTSVITSSNTSSNTSSSNTSSKATNDTASKKTSSTTTTSKSSTTTASTVQTAGTVAVISLVVILMAAGAIVLFSKKKAEQE